MKMYSNSRKFTRLLAALLSVILLLALCPHIMVNATTAGIDTAYDTNAEGNEAPYNTYGPVSLGADGMLKAIHDTGDTPTEEENRGWVILLDVTDSITAEKRMEVDDLVRELQLQYPKIVVLPFSNKILLDEPYYEGMEKSGYATNIVDSYEEVATKYDHIILITDGFQEERYNRPFNVQHHKDVWIYQVGEYSSEVERFFDKMAYAMRGDCSFNLYRADGYHSRYWNEYPYEKVEKEDASLEPIQQPVVDPVVDPGVDSTVDPSQQPNSRTIVDFIWKGVDDGNWGMIAVMVFVILCSLIAAVAIVACQAIKRFGGKMTDNRNVTHVNVDAGKINYPACASTRCNCENCPNRPNCKKIDDSAESSTVTKNISGSSEK